MNYKDTYLLNNFQCIDLAVKSFITINDKIYYKKSKHLLYENAITDCKPLDDIIAKTNSFYIVLTPYKR